MRRRWHRVNEALIEALIRLCGISATIFVLSIFLFVCKEALPLWNDKGFHLREFLFSDQ